MHGNVKSVRLDNTFQAPNQTFRACLRHVEISPLLTLFSYINNH